MSKKITITIDNIDESLYEQLQKTTSRLAEAMGSEFSDITIGNIELDAKTMTGNSLATIVANVMAARFSKNLMEKIMLPLKGDGELSKQSEDDITEKLSDLNEKVKKATNE